MMSAEGRESRYAPEAEALSLRCLLLLEQLLPIERAAFLLHHVFGRSRSETARLVGISDDNCQRLLLRVRRVMTAGKPKIEAERRQRQHVTNGFITGAIDGNLDLLASLLAPDAVAYVDTARAPVIGRRAVIRLVDHLSAELAAAQIEISLDVSEGLVQTLRCAKRTSRDCQGAGT